MTTIGTATLQIIPSLLGVSKAIEQQIDGKIVNVQVVPKVDQRAAEDAGRQTRQTVEKQTGEVKVTPKVDQRAAEDAGRQARETVQKQTGEVKVTPKVDQAGAQKVGKDTADSVQGAFDAATETRLGRAIIGSLQTAGMKGGTRLGEVLASTLPEGLTGQAGRIGDALRTLMPKLGEQAGGVLGTFIGVSMAGAIGAERLDRIGASVAGGLKSAVAKANVGTDVAVSIGNSLAGGLTNISGMADGIAAKISGTISNIGPAVGNIKTLLGGDDSWAAPGLDAFVGALDKATPLLDGMTAASTLASAGATAISTATGIASKAQMLWNLALEANPIGLIVTAIGALVAGLVLFFTKTELGQKIWKTFTEYLSIAWEKIKSAFATAWDAIKVVWDKMVTGAGEVWNSVKDKFGSVVDFVKGLPGKIAAGAKGMWDGLKTGLVAVLNWVSAKWNAFADSFKVHVPGTDINAGLPHLPSFAFLTGGYTGNVPIDQIAGVVHGDEYVVKSESRRKIEATFPGWLDYMNATGKLPGYAGGGLVAGTAELGQYIAQKFGIANIGGWRPEDKYGEHSTGRALDVMVYGDKSKGNAVKDFVLANADAVDLKWVIWQQHLYYPGGGGYDMEDRGSPTQNHMDHVHIFSGPGIAAGIRGALKGGPNQPADTGSGGQPGGPDPTGISAPDHTSLQDPNAVGVALSAGSPGGGSSSVTMPDSISGLSTWGLGDLGITTQVNQNTPERTLELGNAASAAIGGQVSSALGALGIGDSPGWLKGISTFVNGISVSDSSGKKIFGGNSVGGAIGGMGSLIGNGDGIGAGDGYGGAAPLAASAPAASPALDSVAVPAGGAIAAKPAPQFTYNVQAGNVEDAVQKFRQLDAERVASNMSGV